MTFVEPRRITFRIRLGSTQVMLIQAIAHLDAAQLPSLGLTLQHTGRFYTS
jgi:hypothetical protein